jgi:hypothetical protein
MNLEKCFAFFQVEVDPLGCHISKENIYDVFF